MKEAIANAGVLNLIITFVIILLSFFVGSLGYSKAFKVKNAIVNEIEKEEGYNDKAQENIETLLASIGYRMNTNFNSNNCPTESGVQAINGIRSNYQYCVYRIDNCINDSKKCSFHYLVVAYMYFDVPIVNNLMRVPVRGETISFTNIES